MKMDKRVLIQCGLLHWSLVGSPREAAVKELKALLLCGVFYQSGGPAFITQIMFPGASQLYWFSVVWEWKGKQGVACFLAIQGPNKILVKERHIAFSLLISSPFLPPVISNLSESSDVRWWKVILQNFCQYLTWGSILLHQYYFSRFSDYNDHPWAQLPRNTNSVERK